MMNRLARYAMGSVNFEVTGGRGERFLNDCVNAGVPVEHIRPTQTGYLATVPLRDYKRMHKYARRNRCRLRVREKYGAYFALFTYRHRWGILAGLVLCVLLLCMCRNLIWNICFYNFTPEQEASARAQLFEKGIYEGAFQNNEKLVRAAGELFVGSEEYGWVALNFVQARLVVEKTQREKVPELIGTEVTNVVAKSDGIIRRLELVDGYPRVVPGQYVAQGQVLVSGMTLSQYERPLYSHAQAEVLAEVEKSYVYTQPLHVEPVLPQAVSKSYYKLYLPWGELSLYAQLDVPENASQRVLRRPAAPFGFHLPALVEETQVRQAAAVPFDLTPGLAEDIARSRILDAIRAEFGDYELLEETPSAEEADGAVTLTLRVRMLADIGKMVPYEGEAMEPDSTIGADS